MEKLNKIAQKIYEIGQKRPYDRRKKAYIEAEKQIKDLENQAKSVILELAVKEMEALGYHFEIKTDGYARYTAMYQTPDKFTLYIVPLFSHWGYGGNFNKDIQPEYKIQENLGRYTTALIHSEEKDFSTKIESLIEAKYKAYLEAKRIESLNQKNASDIYSLIKDKVSSKSGDYCYSAEKRPWAGNRVRVQWESRTDWSDTATVNIEMYKGSFRVEVDIRNTLTSARDVKDLVAEVEKLVKKYTDYIHKKEGDN